VYEAWLDADVHAEMTGGGATCDPVVGGRFMAWDGYIKGSTLELVPDLRIVQAWRTDEFPDASPDSRLEIALEPSNGGCLVTITHSGLPNGQGDAYKTGWVESYFEPMADYFCTIY
jgi:uncharacterized protein YndB with AHSA1/START domain